jgi:hypothetical protein
MEDKNKHRIQFGETEEEQEDGSDYSCLIVNLMLKVNGIDKKTEISFNIQEGIPMSPIDMRRENISYNLSIEETKRLVEKLNTFVATAEKFSETF